jgi:hypothetical protein
MPYLLSFACSSGRPTTSGRAYALLLVLAAAFLWSGCTKTIEFEDLHLLTGKEWRLTLVTHDGDDATQDCDRDDVLFFTDASKFRYDWGALSCFEPSPIRLDADTWKLVDQRPTIRFKFKIKASNSHGSTMEYWEIVELSETVLILKDDASDNQNRPTIVRRYEH